jgi:hypothetical protein
VNMLSWYQRMWSWKNRWLRLRYSYIIAAGSHSMGCRLKGREGLPPRSMIQGTPSSMRTKYELDNSIIRPLKPRILASESLMVTPKRVTSKSRTPSRQTTPPHSCRLGFSQVRES